MQITLKYVYLTLNNAYLTFIIAYLTLNIMHPTLSIVLIGIKAFKNHFLGQFMKTITEIDKYSSQLSAIAIFLTPPPPPGWKAPSSPPTTAPCSPRPSSYLPPPAWLPHPTTLHTGFTGPAQLRYQTAPAPLTPLHSPFPRRVLNCRPPTP